MIRLHVVAEGQTEEAFVNQVLRPHLAMSGIVVDAHMITTSRRRKRFQRGGHIRFQHLETDLRLWMKEDRKPEARFTTMVDLYRLPPDFPGFEDSRAARDPTERVERLEDALAHRFLDERRFIPYIQLHEFESLVLVDPMRLLSEFPESKGKIERLQRSIMGFKSPEEIDDGIETAPSRRLIQYIPEYKGRKAFVGPKVVEGIGLAKVRERCPHFDRWLKRLESLT